MSPQMTSEAVAGAPNQLHEPTHSLGRDVVFRAL
jgi:hypothetical protein